MVLNLLKQVQVVESAASRMFPKISTFHTPHPAGSSSRSSRTLRLHEPADGHGTNLSWLLSMPGIRQYDVLAT